MSSGVCYLSFIFPYLSLPFSKFPVNKTNATLAFQKIAVAYDVLSTPSSKRLYDRRSPFTKYDVFSTRPTGHAEETFRSVVIGIFNDFLDGDLEVIKTLLSGLFIMVSDFLLTIPAEAISEYNPSLTLGDDGINSVLTILQTIRERALSKFCLTRVIYSNSNGSI